MTFKTAHNRSDIYIHRRSFSVEGRYGMKTGSPLTDVVHMATADGHHDRQFDDVESFEKAKADISPHPYFKDEFLHIGSRPERAAPMLAGAVGAALVAAVGGYGYAVGGYGLPALLLGVTALGAAKQMAVRGFGWATGPQLIERAKGN